MIGGNYSKTGLVMKKKGEQKSTTGIGASLTPDYMEKRRATTTTLLYK